MHRPTNEPWSHAKNRSVWPSLRVKITRRKKWTWIIIFKPAEPHSPWNACVYTVVQLLLICLCVCLCTVVSGLQSKARFTGERKAVWSEVTGCWRYSPPVCARATWNAYSSAANVCQVCTVLASFCQHRFKPSWQKHVSIRVFASLAETGFCRSFWASFYPKLLVYILTYWLWYGAIRILLPSIALE